MYDMESRRGKDWLERHPGMIPCPACRDRTKYVGCPPCKMCGGSGELPTQN